MTSTKISSGLYRISHNGKWFHVEDIVQASDGENKVPGWMLYEIRNGDRVYIDDFSRKYQAIAYIVRVLAA